MSERPIYLDYAATTPVRPEVVEAMLPFLSGDLFGNPSSAHRQGRAARTDLEQARREIAEAMGVEPVEVIFTSGGTEGDNLAVVGASLAARSAGRRMLAAVAATEHKAILAAAHAVTQLGGEERILPVDRKGQLDWEALDAVLALGPAIVSVMWVNNETGVLQPIAEIAARCTAQRVLFHTDIVQAVGKTPVSLSGTAIGLATLSAHKLGGPKGIGALIVRGGAHLTPLIHGGGQQRGLRPGTENLAGAAGLGRAVSLAVHEQETESRRLTTLATDLLARLRASIPDLVLTGEDAPRAPHIMNVLVPGTTGEALLMHLDLAGVSASGGSACSSGAVEPSHVLGAMGIPSALAIGAVRFSLGRGTSPADIARAAEVFAQVVLKVRKVTEVMSHG